ncbi:ABC transporter substrate-binding protein [Sphingomonas sp. Tas61C01]|uniref:ABC transporter substrate-binding protein n=1 Tax=Sphingomonas sp. Tas61C01 TaxID=3458297 RepID=UPI00403EB314
MIVSAIGEPPALIDPAREVAGTPSRLLADATAEGLVRYDAGGQIEAGLAERWIVIDNGASYIFRLREAQWADGKPVTAAQVVDILERQIASRSDNPLRPFLSAVDEIVEMTPQVIEIRLKRPRPDLLKLFAQPELALFRHRANSGGGPMRIAVAGRSPLLRPAFDPNRADPEDRRETPPEEDVRLIGERASRAIMRFAIRDSDLVAGGSFVDWPLLAYATIAPANIRVDPAAGIFGLAIEARAGFLADPANRAALNGAIDRAAITHAVRGDWDPTDRLLPEALDSAEPPIVPPWTLLPYEDRLAAARTRVARWSAGPVTLRVAMPVGPGATLVWGQIARSLIRMGIAPVRVDADAAADLRLVDRVAPYDSARWYLATACAPCGEEAQGLVDSARDAPTLGERARLIAAADRAVADDGAFIPIARPLRWSLVAGRLRQWRPNVRAWHPLNRLRDDTK